MSSSYASVGLSKMRVRWPVSMSRRSTQGRGASCSQRAPGVRVPAARERTRRLVATSDVFYANLLSGVLRDAGIWSFVHGNADAVGATGVPATSLYVAEDDIERARKVIAEVEASARQRRMDRQQVFNCPGCGYDLRATRDRCPECGLAL